MTMASEDTKLQKLLAGSVLALFAGLGSRAGVIIELSSY